MPLIGATLLLVIFAVNVGLGSTSNSAFLSDVGEMLMLICVAILFVIAILKKEADAKK
ncbi:MAG: putative permease [Yoonia sp.]|jgi:predicted permease